MQEQTRATLRARAERIDLEELDWQATHLWADLFALERTAPASDPTLHDLVEDMQSIMGRLSQWISERQEAAGRAS